MGQSLGRDARVIWRWGVLLAVLVSLWGGQRVSASPAAAAFSYEGLHVAGNHIVNRAGQAIVLRGVDRSGTEYACVQGWGFFDGPHDLASVRAMAAWHINAVRIPLNEDCWLAINGVSAAYAGAAYRAAVQGYVALVLQAGLVPILDLHWNAPGRQKATGQQMMPDADHAPAFWRSVATTFRRLPVVFDLYNEPHDVSWTCWRDGGTTCGTGYAVAGMQSLVQAVRSVGARNVLMIGGLNWANDLSGWLAYAPRDPLHNLMASWHVYSFNGCSTAACYNAMVAPLAAHVPVVAGEMGENDCRHGFIDALMPWLDAHGVGYLGWAWDAGGWSCTDGPSLISDYNGTPTGFGLGLKLHLAALARRAAH